MKTRPSTAGTNPLANSNRAVCTGRAFSQRYNSIIFLPLMTREKVILIILILLIEIYQSNDYLINSYSISS